MSQSGLARVFEGAMRHGVSRAGKNSRRGRCTKGQRPFSCAQPGATSGSALLSEAQAICTSVGESESVVTMAPGLRQSNIVAAHSGAAGCAASVSVMWASHRMVTALRNAAFLRKSSICCGSPLHLCIVLAAASRRAPWYAGDVEWALLQTKRTFAYHR